MRKVAELMKLLRIAGITAAVVIIAVGLVVLRLATGPMPIAFLNPIIESNLAKAFPGLAITYQEPSLAWSRDRNTVDLRLLNATIRAADGSLDLTLPEIRIAFSDQLSWRFVFAANRVDLLVDVMTVYVLALAC